MYGQSGRHGEPFRARVAAATRARRPSGHEPRPPRAHRHRTTARRAMPRPPARLPGRPATTAPTAGRAAAPPISERRHRPVSSQRHRGIDLDDHRERGKPRRGDTSSAITTMSGFQDDEAVADRREEQPPQRQPEGPQRDQRRAQPDRTVQTPARRLPAAPRAGQIRQQRRRRAGEGETLDRRRPTGRRHAARPRRPPGRSAGRSRTCRAGRRPAVARAVTTAKVRNRPQVATSDRPRGEMIRSMASARAASWRHGGGRPGRHRSILLGPDAARVPAPAGTIGVRWRNAPGC